MLINLLFGSAASAVAERGVRKVLTDLETALTGGDIAGRLGEWRAILVRGCLSVLERQSFAAEVPPEAESTPEALAATRAFAEPQREFSRTPTPQSARTEQTPRQLFVPDALNNAAHWQFALKTTLAIMIVYSVYTMLGSDHRWLDCRTIDRIHPSSLR
jgi:hypothetical protein